MYSTHYNVICMFNVYNVNELMKINALNWIELNWNWILSVSSSTRNIWWMMDLRERLIPAAINVTVRQSVLLRNDLTWNSFRYLRFSNGWYHQNIPTIKVLNCFVTQSVKLKSHDKLKAKEMLTYVSLGPSAKVRTYRVGVFVLMSSLACTG